jgi:hypothetical protein
MNWFFKETAPIGKLCQKVLHNEQRWLNRVDVFGHELAAVLLHEFTHTFGAGQTEDVRIWEFGMAAFFRGFKWDATGWNRIKKLAQAAPYVDMDKISSNKKPDNNADSITYFAMGKFFGNLYIVQY